MSGRDPIDVLREHLRHDGSGQPTLADAEEALAVLERQLSANSLVIRDHLRRRAERAEDRAVAAEAALAEANRERDQWKYAHDAAAKDWAEANQQARDLADALRATTDTLTFVAYWEPKDKRKVERALAKARAALGRHTQADEA